MESRNRNRQGRRSVDVADVIRRNLHTGCRSGVTYISRHSPIKITLSLGQLHQVNSLIWSQRVSTLTTVIPALLGNGIDRTPDILQIVVGPMDAWSSTIVERDVDTVGVYRSLYRFTGDASGYVGFALGDPIRYPVPWFIGPSLRTEIVNWFETQRLRPLHWRDSESKK